ncbi:helix-turn-helix domain-containing protein [Streptacidiphilus sp. PB12-B1b]|uniref:helix-turn-helix transcriptional regulator n=1 Tax=Streptacidiphilus sp. PB12-B1b TaxID=2705012 RepID=UPI0015FC36E1|nr:helix-turn-helix transcriptional regulator [Streptacidiphilus sp. PB12-B1b]QMU75605.1 helix-turn-helix domain-containing protein [Streptacidiphilus sp. PB12-B1b]
MSTAAAPLALVHSTSVKPDEVRRRELAGFLRSRRERISPEQVGLPAGGRRRTPGLRREEVAQLAAVGVTWYTWLEQSRDIQVSPQVLDAIARALLLDTNERAHLFSLADTPDPAPVAMCPTITPAILAIMEQLEPLPVVAANSRCDVLAYNRTYRHLITDLDAVPTADRNFLWMAFTDPLWRKVLVDYEDATASMVAKFRSAMADHVAEPAWKALLKRLRLASPEFDEQWQRHEVGLTSNGEKRFLNPQVGLLHFEFTTLWLGPRQSTRLITYTPADEETAERVERLHAYALTRV